jgi:hypothetical protein
MLPEILDIILSYHMPVCAEEFAGNPMYTLYWCYNKDALRAILGMTRDQYKVVQSKLGRFMRRVPSTNEWLKRGCGGWALKGSDAKSASDRTRLAAAHKKIARKSYVGLAGLKPPSI